MIAALYRFHQYASKHISDYPSEMSVDKSIIHYLLDLDTEGNVIAYTPMKQSRTVLDKKGKEKTIIFYIKEKVPIHLARSGINSYLYSYFLCDDYKYILGVELDAKNLKLKLSKKGEKDKYKESKNLHINILKNVNNDTARGILNFYDKWNPEKHLNDSELIALAQCSKGNINIGFRVNNKKAHEDREIITAWQNYYADKLKADNAIGTCSITGKENVVIGRTHGQFSGIYGASSTGASLVCFNSDAHWSYGKKQAYNAPVSTEVIEGYGKALQYLIDSKKNKFNLNGKTFLCWTENSGTELDYFNSILNINSGLSGENEILDTAKRISRGQKVVFNGQKINPDIEFYILGLSPANGRLFVNLFYHNTFSSMIEKINNHYERMALINCGLIYPSRIIEDTLVEDAKNKDSDLVPLLLQSIITDCRYPSPIFNKIMVRIRADKKLKRYEKPAVAEKGIRTNYSSRVAFIKAYLLKNSNKGLEEVLTMELNKETTYTPYVLGRLFATLEYIQRRANNDKELNTTIKDRYFDGACATPSVVFPTILQLANKHLKKIGNENNNLETYLKRQVGDLISKITESLPNHLDLEDQGVFIIGYYHQNEEFYTKKEN